METVHSRTFRMTMSQFQVREDSTDLDTYIEDHTFSSKDERSSLGKSSTIDKDSMVDDLVPFVSDGHVNYEHTQTADRGSTATPQSPGNDSFVSSLPDYTSEESDADNVAELLGWLNTEEEIDDEDITDRLSQL